MKNFTTIFLLFLMAIFANAQEKYTVTKISGRIKTENGVFLKPGSVLQKNPSLIYSTNQDAIRAIGNDGKVYLFTASKNLAKNSQGFFTAVLSQFVRTESKGNMSTRAVSDEIPLVEQNLKHSGKILLMDENRFLFDSKKFDVKNGNIFFIQIKKKNDYNDQNTEWRKLRTNGDTLFVRYIDEIPKDGKFENTDFKLGFFNQEKKVSSDVLGFPLNFVYDAINDLENTTKTTIDAYKNQPKYTKEKIRDLAYNQILENLGKPSHIEFLKIFEKLYAQRNVEFLLKYQNFETGFLEDKNHKIPAVSDRYENLTRAELPSSFTLKRFAPQVASQGRTGTCTSWATSYSARSILYNYAHNFAGEDQKKTSFSPEFIYFKIRKSDGCKNGTSIADALETLAKTGTVVSSDKYFNCEKVFTESDFSSALNYKIKGSEYLFSKTKDIVTLVKEALAFKNQPVVIGIEIPQNSEGKSSFMQIGNDGIWRISPEEYGILKNPNIEKSGHAVTVIGYDDNPEILGGAFEIMNSWGTEFWGKKGFCWISYEDFPKVISQAFTLTDLSEQPPANIEIPIKKTEPKTEKLTYKGNLSFLIADENGTKRMELGIEKFPNMQNLQTFKIIPILGNGSRFKINYQSKSPSFLYLINYDLNEVNELFPYDFSKENAIIDMKEALLVLPDFNKGYRLSEDSNTEQMCLIVSKNELNMQSLMQKIQQEKPRDFQIYMKNLIGNFVENPDIKTEKNSLEFSAETEKENAKPLMIFINLKHEEIKQYQE